ncbi:hypothetical protein T261_02908 [Streptomyces lydicus]|nr:hypothetical protein T261_02908 [Streptomyces lydicus]
MSSTSMGLVAMPPGRRHGRGGLSYAPGQDSAEDGMDSISGR